MNVRCANGHATADASAFCSACGIAITSTQPLSSESQPVTPDTITRGVLGAVVVVVAVVLVIGLAAMLMHKRSAMNDALDSADVCLFTPASTSSEYAAAAVQIDAEAEHLRELADSFLAGIAGNPDELRDRANRCDEQAEFSRQNTLTLAASE